jgi:hypothetical protein
VDVRIDLDTLPRYPTIAEVAKLCSRDPRWVQRQIRALGIEPELTLGERQLTRADTLRLVLLSHCQRVLGETSPTPRLIVEQAGAAIEELLRDPSAGTVIVIELNAENKLALSIPSLPSLLAAV